jgi:DNA-binding transcriptional regulator YiaG
MKDAYHFTDGGLRNVWLENGFAWKSTAYGKAVAIEDIDGLVLTICKQLTRKRGKLTGAEFRYLRQHLGLSQKSLAKSFGNSEQSVAIWEKTSKVPLWADKHLRLLWTAAHDASTSVRKLVERLNTVERLIHQKIVLQETRRGWRVQENEEATT